MTEPLRILITGGGGFLGRRLAARLLEDGRLGDRPLQRLTLADLRKPQGLADDARLELIGGDFCEPRVRETLLAGRPDVIFHLAAVVSGAAEQDFDLGMRVNLDGSRALLDACRAQGRCPRLVFASSVAVYGGELPEVVGDDTRLNPQNSYGAQKAAVELLLNDYSRKGFVDGRALRLPTVVVRPGKPNAAASSFASGIIREPLNGESAVCPVGEDTELWIMSPARVVEALLHGAGLPAERLADSRSIALPGLTVSVRQMVDALAACAGVETAARVRWQPDPKVQAIVGSWPARFEPRRALALGFRADADIEEIIRLYREQDAPGAH